MRNLDIFFAVIPYAFSCALGYFIGKAIGEFNEEAVKTYLKIGVYFSVALGLIQIGILIGLKKPIIELYTDSEEVKELLEDTWPVLLTFNFLIFP